MSVDTLSNLTQDHLPTILYRYFVWLWLHRFCNLGYLILHLPDNGVWLVSDRLYYFQDN